MNIRMIDTYALTKSNFMQMESGIPELENLVEKPSYALDVIKPTKFKL